MKKTIKLFMLTVLALTLTCGVAFADTPLINRIQYVGNGKVIISFDRDINIMDNEHSITVYDYAGRIVPSIIAGTYKKQVVLRLPDAGYNQRYRFEIDGVSSGGGSNLFYTNDFLTKDKWYKDWSTLKRNFENHPGRPRNRNSSGMGEGYENRHGQPQWRNDDRPDHQPRNYDNRPERPRSHDVRPERPRSHDVRPERPRSHDVRPERPRSHDVRPERPRSHDVRPERPRSHDVRPERPQQGQQNKPVQPPQVNNSKPAHPQQGQQNKPAQPSQAQNNQQPLRQRVSDK